MSKGQQNYSEFTFIITQKKIILFAKRSEAKRLKNNKRKFGEKIIR